MKKILIALFLTANLIAANGVWQQPQSTATGLGVGQTWQNVASSRSMGSTYTNNTGKPIMLSVFASNTASAAQYISCQINGLSLAYNGSSYGGSFMGVTLIVPDGSTYKCNTNGAYQGWWELR